MLLTDITKINEIFNLITERSGITFGVLVEPMNVFVRYKDIGEIF